MLAGSATLYIVSIPDGDRFRREAIPSEVLQDGGRFQSPMGIGSAAKSSLPLNRPSTPAFQSPMGIGSAAKPDTVF